MRAFRYTVAALAVAVGAALMLPVAGSSADPADSADRANAKIIRVGDDFFSPDSARVGRGRVISWVWSGRNDNAHNIRLRRAPGGVSKGRFRSPTRRTNFRFSRRVRRPGKYVFVCSFHSPEMRAVIRVRR